MRISPRLHAHRVVSRHCHHRHSHRLAAARDPVGARGGAAGPVHQQPEATGPCHSQLPVHSSERFLPLVQNGSFNVWGNTFGTCAGLYYDPWPLDWTASLLGQLEQIPLFNQLNFYVSSGWLGPTSTGWDPQNTTVLSTQVGVLLCPSEDKKITKIGPGTRKNYVANVGGPANFMAWSGVLVPLKDNPPLSYAGRLLRTATAAPRSGSKPITDGSSNTAMFSETLLGSGPISPIALSATSRHGTTYEFHVPLNNIWDQGPQGGITAMLFMQACKGLPGSLAVGGHPAAGQRQHLAGRQRRLEPDAGTRTTTSCPPTARAAPPSTIPTSIPGGIGGISLGTTSGGGWGIVHGCHSSELESSRRCQHLLRRRIRPVHQEPDHLPDVVVARHSQRARGPELRRLLIAPDPLGAGCSSRLRAVTRSSEFERPTDQSRFRPMPSHSTMSRRPRQNSAFFQLRTGEHIDATILPLESPE